MLLEFSQPVFAMACYTGTIFNATSLQIVSLKIVQCDITFMALEYDLRWNRSHLVPIDLSMMSSHDSNMLSGP